MLQPGSDGVKRQRMMLLENDKLNFLLSSDPFWVCGCIYLLNVRKGKYFLSTVFKIKKYQASWAYRTDHYWNKQTEKEWKCRVHMCCVYYAWSTIVRIAWIISFIFTKTLSLSLCYRWGSWGANMLRWLLVSQKCQGQDLNPGSLVLRRTLSAF